MKLKKLIFAGLLAAALGPRWGFADTTTTRWSMTKPDVGSTNWGPKINTNYDLIDDAAGQAKANAFTNTNSFSAVTTFTGQVQAANGSVSAPIFSNTSQTNKGMFFATDEVDFAVGGSTIAKATTSGWISATNLIGTDGIFGGTSPTGTHVAGSIQIFPTTASKGKVLYNAVNNTGNTTLTVANAAQTGAWTYSYPDVLQSANFVMSKGTQTASMTLSSGTITEFYASTMSYTGGIKGLLGAADAQAGYLSEYLSSTTASGGQSIPASATNMVKITLTPGTWMVSGSFSNNGAAASNTFARIGISANTGSFTGTTDGSTSLYAAINAGNGACSFSPVRIRVSANTDYWLVAQLSNGSSACWATLSAVRTY